MKKSARPEKDGNDRKDRRDVKDRNAARRTQAMQLLSWHTRRVPLIGFRFLVPGLWLLRSILPAPLSALCSSLLLPHPAHCEAEADQ